LLFHLRLACADVRRQSPSSNVRRSVVAVEGQDVGGQHVTQRLDCVAVAVAVVEPFWIQYIANEKRV
jgi:hypothetical protein